LIPTSTSTVGPRHRLVAAGTASISTASHPRPPDTSRDRSQITRRAERRDENQRAMNAPSEHQLMQFSLYPAPNVSIDFNQIRSPLHLPHGPTRCRTARWCGLMSWYTMNVAFIQPHGRHRRGDGASCSKILINSSCPRPCSGQFPSFLQRSRRGWPVPAPGHDA